MCRANRSSACALLVAVFLASCASDEFSRYARAAEEARELALLEDVEIVELTREEFARQAAEQAGELSDEYLQYYADTYGRLGYFERDLDLRPVFAGSSADWVGATYSLDTERITLVGEANAQTLVHELVHALQDQHFDLEAYDDLETSDGFLARRAVVEGDAVLAEYRFVAQEQGAELDELDWRSLLGAYRTFSDRSLAEARYPVVFLDYVSFVYAYGLEYTAANLTGVSYEQPDAIAPAPHDWRLADELFVSRPPESTYQVLRRDVHGQEPPMDPIGSPIGLSAVPDALADRLDALDWDVLGEWYVYLLFHPLEAAGSLVSARALAAGWRGDRALFVRELEAGQVGVLWASAWVDEAAAQAVADALWMLHGGQPTAEQPYQGTARDGEALWIERRGDRLIAAKNLPQDTAAALVEAAFAPGARAMPRRNPSLAAAIEQSWRSWPLRRLRNGVRCSHVVHWPACQMQDGL